MTYKICIKLGKRIRKIRKEKDFSQEELADKAKVHRTYMGKIERGESNPPIYTIYRISKALSVHIFDLFKPPLK